MLNRKGLTITVTVFIMIITFHSTFAHVNEIVGTHDQGLVTGSAWASVYRFDDSYIASANCDVSAYFAPLLINS